MKLRMCLALILFVLLYSYLGFECLKPLYTKAPGINCKGLPPLPSGPLPPCARRVSGGPFSAVLLSVTKC